MQTYRFETTIGQDGTVTLDNLPFRAGDRVEVTVRPYPENESGTDQPLRGTILRFDEPTEPVGVEDWEAVR